MRQRLLHIIMVLALLFAASAESHALFSKVHPPEYYVDSARHYFKESQWATGKKFLDEGWDEFGSRSAMNELMGKYYYHFKQYDKARYYLVRALRDDFSNTQAREMLVNVEEETHNYSSAICYINELLEDNPYSRGLWRRKINIYRKQGNNIEADRLLTRLQQIYPNDEVVKNDVVYVNEQRLAKQKHEGDVTGQVETLQNLLRAYPDNEEYYQQLAGVLMQVGRHQEAIETAERGAQRTGSEALMKKCAGMLSEQGRYIEAINYLKECIRKRPSAELSRYLDSIEMAAAEGAQMNDPYSAMAKVYAKQHNAEALNYLLNTSIARGYYDDALNYIKEAKEQRGESEELLYKEFVVNRRLGNRGRAQSALAKIYAINPNNSDVKEYLCEMKYSEAADDMSYGQYVEATELLEFVQDNTTEPELLSGTRKRLFTCYYETRRYEEALEQLERAKDDYEYVTYIYNKAAAHKGADEMDKALEIIEEATNVSMEPFESQLLMFQYEEYAVPYIKGLIEQGKLREAYSKAVKAIEVCPTSSDLQRMAVGTASRVESFENYRQLVDDARLRCSSDMFFTVKMADIYVQEGNYAAAVAELMPLMDDYRGDEGMVRTFSVANMLLAEERAKVHAYSEALGAIDVALKYDPENRDLLYNKGLIYEKMGELDSAYVYQRYLRPGFEGYKSHQRHLEELKNDTFHDEVGLGYTGGGASVASVSYRHKEKNDGFLISALYTAREGLADAVPYMEGLDKGGAGVSLGFDWRYTFDGTPWAVSLGGSWGSDFFPQAAARLEIEKRMKRQRTVGLHATYRRLKALCDDVPAFGYLNMVQGGLSFTKHTEMFSLSAEADVAYIHDKCYVGGGVKGVFYPIESNRTNLFARVGAGNAAPASLVDNGIVCGYGKVGTSVEAGMQWFFNRFVSATLTGTWHNQPLSCDVLTGAWGVPCDAATYKNLFLLQGKLHIAF